MPYELLLSSSAEVIGPWWVLGVSSVAKMLGTIVILSFGPSAHAIVENLLARSEVATRAFHSMERLAGRPMSLVVIFALFAIPFNSDTMILLLLAPLGVRMMCVGLVALAAFIVRGAIVLYVSGGFA
jgi:hypothetical protein